MNDHDRRKQVSFLLPNLGYSLNVDETNTDVLTLIDRTTKVPLKGASIGQDTYQPDRNVASPDHAASCKPDHITARTNNESKVVHVYTPDPQHIKLRPPQLQNLSIDWNKMLKVMACLGCNKIPSPHTRYLCPKGHMFCYKCAMKRIRRLDRKCLMELVKEGSGNTSRHNRIASLCQLEIRCYPCDPIYNALYTSITWKCPTNSAEQKSVGCTKTLPGSRVANHLAKEC